VQTRHLIFFYQNTTFKTWILNQKNSKRLFGGEEQFDLFMRQLDMEPIAIGSPGFYKISYTNLSQVFMRCINILTGIAFVIFKLCIHAFTFAAACCCRNFVPGWFLVRFFATLYYKIR